MHISIHAPTNGATRPEPFCRRVILNFNPRSDERSDISHSPVPAQKPISIHAPTNGATLFLCVRSSVLVISIHAPTNGATSLDSATLMKRPLFQSTLRRTERQVPCSTMSIHSYFNPRSDERSDSSSTFHSKSSNISIHAPTNGATSTFRQVYLAVQISIHAPTNGATFTGYITCRKNEISIHAPTNGATHKRRIITNTSKFQSTLRRTERRPSTGQ